MPSPHPQPAEAPAAPVDRIVVTAPNEAALVQAVLDRAVALSAAEDAPAHDQVIGFRSVAVDLPSLLAETVEQAFGEAAVQGARVIGAEVSGVMPIDEGIRCWGFVSVIPVSGPLAVPAVIGIPEITRQPGALVATLTLDPAGSDA